MEKAKSEYEKVIEEAVECRQDYIKLLAQMKDIKAKMKKEK